MGKSEDRVEINSRVVQWRIENLPAGDCRTCDRFHMGRWEWTIYVENNGRTRISLFPSDPHYRDIPVVSFVMRIISYASGRRQILHPEVVDKCLRRFEDFVWVITDEPLFSSKFIIDVEFTDLKILPLTLGVVKPKSGWPTSYIVPAAEDSALSALYTSFEDSIATDITINATDGSLAAHQAILAVRSPVFCDMFSHDSQEKKLVTVEMTDTSLATCDAFLQYLYGYINVDEFLDQRLPLLRVADKYKVRDLRRSCEKSLTKDLNRNNVLERLQAAHLYKLSELKNNCMRYLFEFGRLHDLSEEITSFLGDADGELVAEVCQKVMASSKAWAKD